MASPLRLVFVSFIILPPLLQSSAQSCSKYSFANNKVFKACSDLPVLNSFLHYNHNPSSGTVQIAYRHTQITTPSRWVAWAINPNSKGMVGAQALVAYQQSDGTMKCYTSPVTSYQTQLQEDRLSFNVSDLSATYSHNEITIFATLHLPNDSVTVNQVWQDGPLSGGVPRKHDLSGANVKSMGTLNFLSGQSGITTEAGNSGTRIRNIHGLLNAVSWGILMPVGAIIARYLRVFHFADPAWFYLHVCCQSVAYIGGAAGWATGLKLGSESSGVQYSVHRTIGIVLFCLGTLQVFALLLRPKKDHKYRFYWNVYHHCIGYTVIVLSIINIFKGLDILNPEKKWKKAYVGVIVVLALSALSFEAYTWQIVQQRKKIEGLEKRQHNTNGANGSNGYMTQSQYRV